MKRIPHQVMIGNKAHRIEVSGNTVNGETILELESLLAEQKHLAIQLLGKTVHFDRDLFNFAINVSGLRGRQVADLLETTPSNISQLRRQEQKDCSQSLWKLFRLVFMSILETDTSKRTRQIDKVARSSSQGNAA